MTDLALAVVDAHHHCYATDLPGAPSMEPYSPADLAADARTAGVDLVGSVHVEAGRPPELSVPETRRWQLESVTAPHRVVLVAAVQLEKRGLPARLAELQQSAGVVGVRQMLDWHGGLKQASPLLRDGQWRRGLATLAGRALSFDLQVLPAQLPEAAALVGEFPEVEFVLNHGGLHIPWQQADLGRWAADLQVLAKWPNVAVKTSGFDTVDPAWDSGRVSGYLRTLLDCFGPDRTLFASNFPIDRATIGYHALVAHHLDVLAGYSAAERSNVFRGNASRIYRIEGVTGV
ncbi:putative TIM-barrel fold metal-dependent hydrolase [Nakamurella sp. UYEF19]|uniref:amidohydrolase family protein n=1 Tax=Nakamurella sp. UYEF19 TaxID=1756392 RepID=UPI00339ACDD2